MLQLPCRSLNMGLRKYLAEYGAVDRLGELSNIFGRRAFVIGEANSSRGGREENRTQSIRSWNQPFLQALQRCLLSQVNRRPNQ